MLAVTYFVAGVHKYHFNVVMRSLHNSDLSCWLILGFDLGLYWKATREYNGRWYAEPETELMGNWFVGFDYLWFLSAIEGATMRHQHSNLFEWCSISISLCFHSWICGYFSVIEDANSSFGSQISGLLSGLITHLLADYLFKLELA